MTMTVEMGRLKMMRQRIADEISAQKLKISQAQEVIAKLAVDDRELEIAERVLTRIAQEFEGLSGEAVPDRDMDTAAIAYVKPPNIPTIPDMIREALELARSNGSPGLEPAGLLSYVRGRYWHDAPPNSVGPIAWRMWKRRELVKEGSIYRLPNRSPQGETGAVAAPVLS